MVEHALHVDLRAELLPGPLRLDAAGCLTEANCAKLLSILDQAVALEGCPSVTINLLGLEHLEPHAWHALAHHLAALEAEREAPGEELLKALPVISIQAPARPRHCTDRQTLKAFRQSWLEDPTDPGRADPRAEETDRHA